MPLTMVVATVARAVLVRGQAAVALVVTRVTVALAQSAIALRTVTVNPALAVVQAVVQATGTVVAEASAYSVKVRVVLVEMVPPIAL